MSDGSPGTQAITQPAAQIVVVPLPAEVDVTNSGQVLDALARALADGAAVLIADATGTTFCDCAGVSALTSACHQVAAGTQVRVAASPAVRRVLELTGTDHLFDIYSSLDAALDSDGPPVLG